MRLFLERFAGELLLGIAALAALGVLGLLFGTLTKLAPTSQGALPLLAIGGIVVLVLLLASVAIVFKILGLTNETQAMGLPEGSIRAVISLSLIVLFAILSVFLYQGVGGSLSTISNLTDAERLQFFRDHPTAQAIQSVLVREKNGDPVILKKDEKGEPIKTADGKLPYLYEVTYRTPNSSSDDFAKQLLVLLGTLMTAVTSFYLGAGTVTSAVKAGDRALQTDAANSAAKVSDIEPKTYKVADGPTLPLKVSGINLGKVSAVKIVRNGSDPVIGTDLKKSSTSVTCNLAVNANMTGNSWDVVIEVAGKPVDTKQGALLLS